MSTSQAEESYRAGSSDGGTVCAWCNSPVPHGAAFKPCRGCNAVVYCGRECRAAAWPTHKQVKSRLSPAAASIPADMPCPPPGRHAAAAIPKQAGDGPGNHARQAVKEWAEIHKYGLTVLAHSALRLPCGVKANLRRGRVPVFVVERAPLSGTVPVAADANPATAFTLCAVKLVEAGHAPPLPNPEALELSRLAAAFDEPGFRGDSDKYTAPAGYVPVCFELGNAFVHTTQCAVYRASHHTDDTELEDKTIRMLRDVTHVFITLINNGVVFRPPSEGPAALPDVGRMVRARGGWRWQQDPGAWDLTDMLMPLLDIPFQTSYSVIGLWARFQQW